MAQQPPLADRECRPIPKGAAPLDQAGLREHLASLPGWEPAEDGKAISKLFKFDDYYRTMSFVNAVAHIANVQDHHPDMLVTWGKCRVSFSTHTVGGVSENDVICAAKVERALRG